jgi:RNA polymerase sigma-70 factor (ECF subfamily)
MTRRGLRFVPCTKNDFRYANAPDWDALRRTACNAARWLPSAAVEDAAQEALIRAWRSWERGGPPESPVAWMTTIARREAVRWKTGPNGLSWASTLAEPPEAPATAPDPVASLDVRHALARLPARDRTLVLLRYRADLTQAQIAELTGMPEGTVKVRLHRARKRLRSQLS